MTNFARWIEANAAELTLAATETLSQNELLQSQVAESVEAFYEALLRSASTFDPTPLYKVLFDWVDARSGPIGEENASLVPVLAQLKLATSDQIFRLCSHEVAVS